MMLFHTVSFLLMNLVVTVLLDRMPRTSSFSFHVDIFDTFRGHGEAVLVHLATEEVRFACGGGVVEGLSSDDYFHELLSRLVLGRKQARTVRTYPSAAGVTSLGVMRSVPGVTCSAVPLLKSTLPPCMRGFKGYSGGPQFIVGHAVARFEVYHHLGCDVVEDEGLIGGRYGDEEVGSSHAVAILISFISLVGCTKNEAIFLDDGYNP